MIMKPVEAKAPVPPTRAVDVEHHHLAKSKKDEVPYGIQHATIACVSAIARKARVALALDRDQVQQPEQQNDSVSSVGRYSIDVINENLVLSDESHSNHRRRENGTSSSEELLVPNSPFADAVPIPKQEGKALNLRCNPSEGSTDSTESSTHSELTKYVQQHYNPDNDVVMRLEYIPERKMKTVLLSVWALEIVGLFLLALGVGLKIDKPQRWFLRKRVVEITNVALGIPCLLGLVIGGTLFFRRLYQANRSGKRWSIRRKRLAQKTAVEHVITTINVTLLLVTNLYMLGGDCRWFSKFGAATGAIEWSCWNAIFALFLMQAHDSNPWIHCTGLPTCRPDSIIMDAPRIYHLNKLLYFLVVEGMIIAAGTLHYRGLWSEEDRHVLCTDLKFGCVTPTPIAVLVSLIIVSFIGYFLGTLWYLHVAYKDLRQKPYTSVRMAHLNVRLNARLRTVAMGFFILCLICYVWIGWATCVSYLQSWLGFQAMMLVISGLTAASTYIGTPANPTNNHAILQIWLQEFSWSEGELEMRRAERMSSLQSPELEREPMFCFETSLKMLYWSMLVYRFEEPVDPKGVTLESAMKLYDLKHFELVYEKLLDTKALMAWNKDTVVLCFRGTASFKNVVADLKAWYACHKPKRGNPCMGTRPYVHQGFQRSWEANGLNDRVVSRVNQIVNELRKSTRKFQRVRVFVTGHSLGGALATLAAIDIQSSSPCREAMDISCYTFGAPRTGNHAFARDFNGKVPNSWSIINDQDTVPRSGKFVIMYKRPGQRVLINTAGDMIVRPSFIEAAVQRNPTSSVSQHLLVNYQRAHVAIIKAQFTSKRLRDGSLGVLRMAEACGMRNLLRAAGIDTSHLRKMQRYSDGLIPQKFYGPKAKSLSPKLQSLSARLQKSKSKSQADFDLAGAAAAVDMAVALESTGCTMDDVSHSSKVVSRPSPFESPAQAHDIEDVSQVVSSPANDRTSHPRKDCIQQQSSTSAQQQPSPGKQNPWLPHQHRNQGQPLGQQQQQHQLGVYDDDEVGNAQHVAIDVQLNIPATRFGTAKPGNSIDDQRMASEPSCQLRHTPSMPNEHAPLQSYTGCITDQPGSGMHCRYTHFNGIPCPKGGLAVEQQTGKCQSDFSRLSSQALDDVVEGNDGMGDVSFGIVEKSRAAAADAARRMMGVRSTVSRGPQHQEPGTD